MSAAPAPLRVVLTCSGLGRVRRGFESFTDQCFRALRDDERLRLALAKGGGPRRPAEYRIPSTFRMGTPARLLGRLAGRDAYFAEQATFAAALLPLLLRFRPHVVLYSDPSVGGTLGRLRERLGLRLRLLLSNGGPLDPPYRRPDLVQHVTRHHLERALAYGEPPERHVHVPYGFELAARPPTPLARRPDVRRELGLPGEGPIVLSVGTLNRSHKRQDHVVRACATARSRPFLVLLGDEDEETPAIRRLAGELLGPARHTVRTTDPDRVADYYAAADVFVLASLHEGFARVTVEAAAAGLPCLVHDYAIPREVLGRWGTYLDMADDGALAHELDAALAREPNDGERHERHRALAAHYDWGVLKERYVELLFRCAA